MTGADRAIHPGEGLTAYDTFMTPGASKLSQFLELLAGTHGEK
jgi:hypothetical protein